MRYRHPDSVQQAQLLVGTKVQVWLQPEEDQPGRWHSAVIVGASVLGDDGKLIETGTHFLLRLVHHRPGALPLHSCTRVNICCSCTCRYDEPYGAEEDRDHEHISFAEAFNGVTGQKACAVRVVETPAGARRLLEDLRVKTPAEKGKAVLHSGEPMHQQAPASSRKGC